MNVELALLTALLLLAANAYFVGAEFAVMAARRSQIEPLVAQGSRRARRTLQAMESVSAMLACAQLGVTVCSVGLGAVAEPALAQLIEGPLHSLGILSQFEHPIAFTLALTIVVYLHVVIGEMVPKNLAIAAPDRVALALAPPLLWLAKLLGPLIWVMNGVANAVLRAFGVEPKDEVTSTFTAEEVGLIVDQSRRAGLLADDHGLVTGALEFSERTAGEVAVPVAGLTMVTSSATPADIERLVAQTGFSRFPVAAADGELLGYLHIKDVLYADEKVYDSPVPAKRIRSLVTVSGGDEVEEVLAAMQGSGAHLARVLDAQGVIGVVFLEDVLEELVGQVAAETPRSRGNSRDSLPSADAG